MGNVNVALASLWANHLELAKVSGRCARPPAEKSAVCELICASEMDIRSKGGGVILYVPGDGFSMAIHYNEGEDQPAQQWEAVMMGMMVSAMTSLEFCQQMIDTAESTAKALAAGEKEYNE